MDILTVVVVFAAAFVAIISQLLTGFGFALVLIPLLMLVIEPTQAVTVSIILGLVLNSTVAYRERAHIRRAQAGQLIASSVFGLPLGLGVLYLVSAPVLRIIIIAVVALALIIVALKVAIRATRFTTLACGLLSGTLLPSTGVSGPPLVVLMRAQNYTVRQYRATLAAVFTVQCLAGLLLLLADGRLQQAVFLYAGMGALMLPLGYFVGERLFRHIDAARLTRGIILMLLLCMVFVVLR